MANTAENPPLPKPYEDKSISNWMGELKKELDIAPVTAPPVPDTKPDPEPKKPDEKPPLEPTKPISPDSPKDSKQDNKSPASDATEKRWPRTAVEWDNYKKADKERLDTIAKERDEIKAERDRIKSEIEQARKQGPSPELEALKKERDALSDRLRLVDVEKHPRFQAYFENKTNAQLELAKRIVNGNPGADRIVELLKAPEGQLRDMELERHLGQLTTIQQSRISSVLNNLEEIRSERAAEISKAKESYEQIRSQNEEAVKTHHSKAQSLFTDIVQNFSDKEKGNPVYQKREGDEAWNTSVDQRVEAAKTLLFGDSSQDRVMKAALDSVAYPVVLTQLQDVMKENARLQEQIKSLTAAQPKVEGGKSAPMGAPTNLSPKAKGYAADPMQAAPEWMKIIHAPVEQ